MKATDCIQVIAYFGALLALTPILGLFMAREFNGFAIGHRQRENEDI